MFWAIARSRQLSGEEMNGITEVEQPETTSTSSPQRSTPERQLTVREGTTSSTPNETSNRMMPEDDKADPIPTSKTKGKDKKASRKRKSEAVDWGLQAALQAERNKLFDEYNNRVAQRDASAGR